MNIELLISALNADPEKLISEMSVDCDAVLVNQCDKEDYGELAVNHGTVRVFSCKERGIGLSRNKALDESKKEIILFSDDDIRYKESFEATVISEFEAHPEADGIFFNFEVDPSRQTYENTEFGPVTIRNSGRYPTYSLAVKRDIINQKRIRFSPLFGGGAKYSCGEDSLFIIDCLKSGIKLYKSPKFIGREEFRPSTWFNGYTEKFFFDKGVLYPFLYGPLASLVGARFILKHKAEMCKDINAGKAYSLLLKGIKEGRMVKKEISK